MGDVCEHGEYGTCNLHRFLIDLIFIFLIQNFFHQKMKKVICKLMKKPRETNYNLTTKHFTEHFEMVFI